MRTAPLGRTGIEITEFVFGAGSIGGVGSSVALRGQGVTAEQGLARLDEAYELGVRVIDTSNSYAGGESERTVGHWLRDRQRADVLVQTKVGVVSEGRPSINLTAEHIEQQLPHSIERLGRVDLYHSHAPDPNTPIEQTMTAFAAAMDNGLIRAYGVCNVDERQIAEMLAVAADRGLPRPEWVQNRLNLLAREDERELLPLLAAEGLGYMAFSPLAGGVLSARYLDGPPSPGSRIAIAGDTYYRGMHAPDNIAKVARLRDMAGERGIGVAGLALAWLRAHPSVSAPIVAPSTDRQWQAVREALATDLTADEAAEIAAMFD